MHAQLDQAEDLQRKLGGEKGGELERIIIYMVEMERATSIDRFTCKLVCVVYMHVRACITIVEARRRVYMSVEYDWLELDVVW